MKICLIFIDLLTLILNPNPKKRYKLDQIKTHPWFLEYIQKLIKIYDKKLILCFELIRNITEEESN